MKKLGLLFFLFLSLSAYGGMETYDIDSAHSSVGFKIKHLFSKVPGHYNKFSGTITLDPKQLDQGNVKVELDATSINTSNAKRDEHLKGTDFFDVAKYPTISFSSTSFKSSGKGKFLVNGNLTMHGVTKPIQINMEAKGFGPDAWGSYRAGFEGSTKLNRKDYGIVWNKALEAGGVLLGDEVEIDLSIEGIRKDPDPAAASTKPKK